MIKHFELGQMRRIVIIPSTLNSIKFIKRLNKSIKDLILPVKNANYFSSFNTALYKSLCNVMPSFQKGSDNVLFRIARVESGRVKFGDGHIEESVKERVADCLSDILKDIPSGNYQELSSPHGVINMTTEEERCDAILLGSYVGLVLNNVLLQDIQLSGKEALWKLSDRVKKSMSLGSDKDDFVIQYFECMEEKYRGRELTMRGLTYYIYFNPNLGMIQMTSGDEVKFIVLERERDLPISDKEELNKDMRMRSVIVDEQEEDLEI